MNIAENIYYACPAFIQNALISAYGYSIKRSRYSGKYQDFYNFLSKSQFYSADELNTLQSQLFSNLIKYATEHVDFYKNILTTNGLRSSEISIDNYKQFFPVIRKDLLRNSGVIFQSKDRSLGKPLLVHTSGTSGTPLKLMAFKSSLQQNYAFFSRFLNWAGVRVGEKSATFAGRLFIPPAQSNPPYWRINKSLNNMLFSSYHISENSIPAYISALEDLNPTFIDSYPSAIYEIAKYISERNYPHHINPIAIVTSSETLHTSHRDTIEKTFNCKVFDHLGSAEMVTFITQCEHGSYHINPEYGLIEILDENNNPVRKGEPGRLVCTGLFNYAMPLIRYELGDSIVKGGDSCVCGRNFPIVESILGRTDDIIIGCDGRKVGRLDPIFKGLDSSIIETQIIQEDLNNITIKMVCNQRYNKNNTLMIVSELEKRVGSCIHINVKYVDNIPKTASGKFRSVISHVNNH